MDDEQKREMNERFPKRDVGSGWTEPVLGGGHYIPLGFDRSIVNIPFFRRRPEFRRCPGCYLPMRHSFMRDQWECDFCGADVTRESIEDRSRWRRFVDWITGMEF